MTLDKWTVKRILSAVDSGINAELVIESLTTDRKRRAQAHRRVTLWRSIRRDFALLLERWEKNRRIVV